MKQLRQVMYRPWWKFWRHPMRGLNPWGWWQLFDPGNPDRWLQERHFDGYYSPSDGGGATYRWNPDPTEADNDKGIVRPDSGGTGAWIYEPPDNAD